MAATTGVDMVVRIRKVLAIPRSWYVCFSVKIRMGNIYVALHVTVM